MRTLRLMQPVCTQANKVGPSVQAMLQNDLSGLCVVYSLELAKWISVTLSGPDEEVGEKLLAKKYGMLCDFKQGDKIRACIAVIKETGFLFDAGTKSVLVHENKLRSLGRGTPLQIASRYGLIRHLPLEVILVKENEAELTKNQVDTLWRWKKGTDRINVNNATRAQIHSVLKRTGHARDIYAIERLGILEHSIVCKRGTDAPGLIAAIGPYLESELGCIIGDKAIR